MIAGALTLKRPDLKKKVRNARSESSNDQRSFLDHHGTRDHFGHQRTPYPV